METAHIFLDRSPFSGHSKSMRFWSLILISLLWAGAAGAGVSSLVADVRSGFVLDSQDAHVPQPPASLTKVMTLYLLFGAVDGGILNWDDALPISEKAAAQPKSKLGLIAGETISVREAAKALIVKSANDVAVVVAEALGQSEERFAEMMTQTARGLGLKDTVFKNASGLHVNGQVSTARDMAVLTMALITHFPKAYTLFSEPSCAYKGQTYHSHNTVLKQYEGAEGLKTGFVSAVGYNIISTARHGDSRLVSVVIGEESATRRDMRAMRLLDKGFHQVDVQQKAQAEGRLKRAFNPLNRRAFIGPSPVQVLLPTMKTCVDLSRRKCRELTAQPVRQVAVTAVGAEPEQGDSWTIQVGAFEGQEKARRIAEKAMGVLGASQKEIITPRADNRFFRSRIRGFTHQEADQACRRLKNASWPCFTVAPNS